MSNPLLDIVNDDLIIDESGAAMAPDLDLIPGSSVPAQKLNQTQKDTDWENDGDHSKFMAYLSKKMSEIPKHNGTTTVGCERAIAYLSRLDREISKAISSDYKNQIDDFEAEKARDTIKSQISRLEDALANIESGKVRRTASVKLAASVYTRIGPDGDPQYYIKAESNGEESLLQVALEEPTDEQVKAYMDWETGKFKKEASSARIVLMADPFLHEITNIIIRSHVTYGRNVENVYRDLDKKYAFSNRDHLAIHSLLREKGLLLDRDFSRIGEEVEIGTQSVGSKSYPA